MKRKNNFSLNIIPSLSALSQTLKGDYVIRIQPDPNPTQFTKEITQIKLDKKNNTLTIYTKSQSEERKALIESIEKDKNWQIIQKIVEEELSKLSIAIAKEERINVLGNSDLQSRFLEVPNFLSVAQKRRLTYFLPYIQQIKNDLKLLENCLFSILGQPVKLSVLPAKKMKQTGMKINQWIVNGGTRIGGISTAKKATLQIQIGPIPMEAAPDFVQGGHWRTFLEAAIYPRFIPENLEQETKIILAANNNQFTVSNNDFQLRIGINSIIA